MATGQVAVFEAVNLPRKTFSGFSTLPVGFTSNRGVRGFQLATAHLGRKERQGGAKPAEFKLIATGPVVFRNGEIL